MTFHVMAYPHHKSGKSVPPTTSSLSSEHLLPDIQVPAVSKLVPNANVQWPILPASLALAPVVVMKHAPLVPMTCAHTAAAPVCALHRGWLIVVAASQHLSCRSTPIKELLW